MRYIFKYYKSFRTQTGKYREYMSLYENLCMDMYSLEVKEKKAANSMP